MRFPIMPAMLLLVAAGLLYVIYQGSVHLAVTPRDVRPASAAPATGLQVAPQPLDMEALTPSCRAILQAARAAQRAVESGEALETFLRRPVIAWQDDETLREKLRSVALAIYASPPQAPAQRLREVLRAQQCLPDRATTPKPSA
ncbi:MAG TPA: hypothetical protein VF315_09175 [Steroidobacteraceae bacterium]